MTFVVSEGRMVRVPSSPAAAMREAVTELSRTVEDRGWDSLTQDRVMDRDPRERIDLIRRARVYRRRSPLAIQGFRLLRDYVLGQGVTLRPAAPLVAEVVEEFWEHPVNKAAFTSVSAMAEMLDGVYTDGDYFIVAFPDEELGTLELGTIDATDVVDVVGRPGNWRVPMWYKARRPARRYDFAAGSLDIDPGERSEFVWYRALGNDEPLTGGGRGGRYKSPRQVEPGYLIHVYRHRRGKFGEPDLGQAALDYMKGHKEFIDGRMTMNRAASTIAWRQSIKGGATDVQNALDRVRTAISSNRVAIDGNPPPTAGSWHVENESSRLEWMKTDTGGAAASNDERVMRMYAGAAIGVMNHYFGDEASANLATATAMELPMLKNYEGYQEMTAGIIRAVLKLLLVTCEKAGRIGPEDKKARKRPSAAQDALAKLAGKDGAAAELGAGTKAPMLGAGDPETGLSAAQMAALTEAGDDHFYGPWHGGKSAAMGGGGDARAADQKALPLGSNGFRENPTTGAVEVKGGFEVLGTTSDRDTCDNCGKGNLQKVVALKNPDGEHVFYGVDCASTVTGSKPERIKRAAEIADGNKESIDRGARLSRALKAIEGDEMEARFYKRPDIQPEFGAWLTKAVPKDMTDSRAIAMMHLGGPRSAFAQWQQSLPEGHPMKQTNRPDWIKPGVDLSEASTDDHYYGPWHGGSRASGGGPGRLPTLEQRRADLASKVGAENVGNIANLRKGKAEADKAPEPTAAKPFGSFQSAEEEAAAQQHLTRLQNGSDRAETAILLSSDGTVWQEWGDSHASSVQFSSGDRAASKDRHILHNHPGIASEATHPDGRKYASSPGLSMDDVNIALLTNAASIHAIQQTPDIDGKTWRFELHRGPKGWGEPNGPRTVMGTRANGKTWTEQVPGEGVKQAYNLKAAEMNVKGEFQQRIAAAGAPGSDAWKAAVSRANSDHSHEVMTRFAILMERDGFPVAYRRTEVKARGAS